MNGNHFLAQNSLSPGKWGQLANMCMQGQTDVSGRWVPAPKRRSHTMSAFLGPTPTLKSSCSSVAATCGGSEKTKKQTTNKLVIKTSTAMWKYVNSSGWFIKPSQDPSQTKTTCNVTFLQCWQSHLQILASLCRGNVQQI